MKRPLISYLVIFLFLVVSGCSSNNQNGQIKDQKLMKFLIGTYIGKGSEGIYAASLDPATGKVSGGKLVAKVSNPSYLAISADQKYVYSVGEVEEGYLFSYQRLEKGDSLVEVDKIHSNGVHPCYVDCSKSGLLAVANYTSGTGAVFQVMETGAISESVFSFSHSGTGPVKDRQEAAHAHCAVFSPNDHFLYVADLGTDKVMGYRVSGDSASGQEVVLQMQPGDGPRHLVFHPEKSMAFIINELSNTVVSVSWDPGSGMMQEISRAATLPDDFTAVSKCADIHVSPDGRFLYASNRGHDSIAIFSISQNGTLTRIGIESVQGKWPRNFVISPDGRYLLVANRNTNDVVVFERDSETGLLRFTGNKLTVPEPVCLKFW